MTSFSSRTKGDRFRPTRCIGPLAWLTLCLSCLNLSSSFTLNLSPEERPSPTARSYVAYASGGQDISEKILSSCRLLPLRFEENVGQGDRIRFLCRGEKYCMYIMPTKVKLILQYAKSGATKSSAQGSSATLTARAILRMTLQGANATADGIGIDPLAAKTNYFIGKDHTRWRAGIANYSKVRCRQVYPGIDMTYHGEDGQLEYDFDLVAGADPALIRLAFDGVKKLGIDARGDLILHSAVGEIRQHRPVAYQERDGIREEVTCSYSIKNNGEVGFKLSGYDKDKPVTIDPVLSYSSYLG